MDHNITLENMDQEDIDKYNSIKHSIAQTKREEAVLKKQMKKERKKNTEEGKQQMARNIHRQKFLKDQRDVFVLFWSLKYDIPRKHLLNTF